MASLQQLLSEEGFERSKSIKPMISSSTRNLNRNQRRKSSDESIALPIYICRNRRQSFDTSSSHKFVVKHKESSISSSKRIGSESKMKNEANSKPMKGEEPAIDEVAIRAVISILTGYIGRYLKDETFREAINKSCSIIMTEKKTKTKMETKKDSGSEVFANLEFGIKSIEKLLNDQTTKKELRINSLSNSINVLNVVASLNSKRTKNSTTCGVPNSHLSSCAQLYLSIIYKLEKNDRVSARHLLQVFVDSPFSARTRLLPDLWEHFFLPHLLHIKIWYHKEVENLSSSSFGENDKTKNGLRKTYDEHLDKGTTLFALYYKEWLKVSAKSPAVPFVPLPSIARFGSSRRKSLDSNVSQSSVKKNLYQEVFGPTDERRSMDFDKATRDMWTRNDEEKEKVDEENYNLNYVHNNMKNHRRSSSQSYQNSRTELWPVTQKSDVFRFISCQSVHTEALINGNTSLRKQQTFSQGGSSDLTRAISTICSSQSLPNCESAVRVITKAWLDSNFDPTIESALSKPPIIEGILEVLFTSINDEILELAISILTEFASRNELNKRVILNSDPQLEIFTRLLSTSLFLKASVLLYTLKPKAKQMVSVDWVGLVLRVLEFGNRLETLFTVRCSPKEAAFYFLEQLLTGFDEDRNLENGNELVSLGGLSLLVRSIESGDVFEKNKAGLMICCCVRANPNCRNYLAENLDMVSVLELIGFGNQKSFNKSGFGLLVELLCLDRRTEVIKLLEELKHGWRGLNTMHIFSVYLHQASPLDRPLVAAILLQLDLLGDPWECSVFRDDAVDAIVTSLDCKKIDENVQQQTAKALIMLGGTFPYNEDLATEKWLLQPSNLPFSNGNSNEDEASENWQKKISTALLNDARNERFLIALSDSVAEGIPSLAQASLFTISWLSKYVKSVSDENFRSTTCSILMPQLLESSSRDKDVKERLFATLSLQHLVKCSENVSVKSLYDIELQDHTRNHRSSSHIETKHRR